MRGQVQSLSCRVVTLIAASLALSTWCAPRTALAQSDSNRATARALAEEGYNALKLRKYDIAEDRFRRADALVHAPTLVVDQGRALIGLGRYLDAQEKFELVLREGVADNAPVVWKNAVADASKLLGEVRPKVAWLTIVVPHVQHPRVLIGGRPIAEAAIGVKFALNPGTQTVEAAADGYNPKSESITLGEGSEQTLEITLSPAANVTPAVHMPPVAPAERHKAPGSGKRTVAYVAFGTSAAGLVVGSIAGALALQKRSNLNSTCVNGQCPKSAEPTLNSYHSLGIISGIGFGVGLVGAATGFVLYGSGGRTNNRKASGALQLEVGPSALSLQGAF